MSKEETFNPTFVDRAVGWFSPARGLKRLATRAALQSALWYQGKSLSSAAQAFGYEGAKKGRSVAGWFTPSTSANAEIGPQLAHLRNRSRDLVRNNPNAAKIIGERVIRSIGTGIAVRSAAKNQRTRDALNKYFPIWADAIGYNALQRVGAHSVYESGECLLRHRYVSPAVARKKGLPVPYWPVLLEPDFIDTNKNSGVGKTQSRIVNGVQYTEDDIVEGYWLFENHPGEVNSISNRVGQAASRFVSAKVIEHAFRATRPGQGRGVPLLAPVIQKLQGLDDLQDAILVRKKTEACFAAFVTKADAPGIGKQSEDPRIEEFSPGMVQYLRAGEGVAFAQPSTSGGEVEYIRMQKQEIAAGAFTPYELATGDMSQTNYSSFRGGAVGFKDDLGVDQWQVFIPFFGAPVWRLFVDACFFAGLIDEVDYEASYGPPPFNLLDRQAEAEADQLEVAIGKVTWPQMVASNGNDPEAQMEEIARSQKAFRDKEIELPELYGGKTTDGNDNTAAAAVRKPAAKRVA